MAILIRQAVADDASALCEIINPLIAAGGTTAHKTPFTPDRMIRHYIAPPRSISCAVALSDGVPLGFQALEWADPDWTGEGKLPDDWAVVASFVSKDAQGQGIGAALFDETRRMARQVGVAAIDATIRRYNRAGLTYYSRIGFVDHANGPETISKAYRF